jgi:hypothetical protein
VVWQAAPGGRATRFRLAGINNQNFLMQDDATGSWWQQQWVAIRPGARHRPERIFHDEVAFRIWVREHPGTRVLVPSSDTIWVTFSRDWETETAKMPVATRVRLDDSLPPRTLVVGVAVGDDAVAYPMAALEKQSPILDRVGGQNLLLVLGDDRRSVRAFVPEAEGRFVEFFVVPERPAGLGMPATGSRWDFSGTAPEGALAGTRLRWGDKDYCQLKTYHPGTRVQSGRQ